MGYLLQEKKSKIEIPKGTPISKQSRDQYSTGERSGQPFCTAAGQEKWRNGRWKGACPG
jgi:hypothetical protein